MKKFIFKLLVGINKFADEIITPTVSLDYVIAHDASWVGNNCMKDKHVYYWVGDFINGEKVKVKSIEVLRDKLEKAELTLSIVEQKNMEVIETLRDN